MTGLGTVLVQTFRDRHEVGAVPVHSHSLCLEDTMEFHHELACNRVHDYDSPCDETTEVVTARRIRLNAMELTHPYDEQPYDPTWTPEAAALAAAELAAGAL